MPFGVLLGRIAHRIVDEWNLVLVEVQQLADGGVVHRATRDGCQSDAGAIDVDVLAGDARIDGDHLLRVLVVALEFVQVGHEEEHHGRILDGLLAASNDGAVVSRRDLLQLVRLWQIFGNLIGREHKNADFLAVHRRGCGEFAVLAVLAGGRPKQVAELLIGEPLVGKCALGMACGEGLHHGCGLLGLVGRGKVDGLCTDHRNAQQHER